MKQRIVLAVGTILVIVAGLFPHWNFVATPRPGWTIKKSAGYSPLFSPPVIRVVNTGTDEEEPTTGRDPRDVSVELDWSLLLAEWTTILLATSGLFLFLRLLKSTPTPPQVTHGRPRREVLDTRVDDRTRYQ